MTSFNRVFASVMLFFGILFMPSWKSFAKSSQEASDRAMRLASKLVARDDLDSAIKVLLRHLKKNGSDPVASAKLTDILIQKGDFAKAFRIARIIRAYYPTYDWPYILQFKSALELRNFAAAQKILKKFDKVSTTANREQLRGDYYRLKGDLLKADDYYEKAMIKANKDNSLLELRVWNLKNATGSFIDANDFDTAELAIERLMKISRGKQKAETLSISADLRIRQGKLELAERDLTELLKTGDQFSAREKLSDVRVTLANQAYASHNIELAEKWLNAVDKLGPDFHSFVLRGNMRRDEGKFELAGDLYDKAKRIKDDDASLYEAMAWNYTQWTRYQDAEEAIMSAIKLLPDEPRYRLIHANQLKNGRKLSKALGELIMARRLCEVDQDCESFDSEYDERFFENTNAEGFSLDVIGIPATMTAELAYRDEPSDLVGLSRGLKAQDVSADNYSLLLSPSKSPIIFGRFQFGYYKAEQPFVSIYYERSQKIGGRRDLDPSIPFLNQVAGIETEGSFPLPFLGVISIFPYMKFTNSHARSFDTGKISGQLVNSNEYIIGSRALWQFRWYLPALEGEIGGGKLLENSDANFTTIRARLGLQQNFTKYLRFSIDGSLYHRRASSLLIQSQKQGLARIALLPHPTFGISTGYQILSTDDQKISTNLKTEDRVRTHQRIKSLGFTIGSGDVFRLTSIYSRCYFEPYEVYNNDSINTEMEFSYRLKLNRDIGDKIRIPYIAPARLIVGHNLQLYKQENRGDRSIDLIKRRTLPSYYVATKLFW